MKSGQKKWHDMWTSTQPVFACPDNYFGAWIWAKLYGYSRVYIHEIEAERAGTWPEGSNQCQKLVNFMKSWLKYDMLWTSTQPVFACPDNYLGPGFGPNCISCISFEQLFFKVKTKIVRMLWASVLLDCLSHWNGSAEPIWLSCSGWAKWMFTVEQCGSPEMADPSRWL